MLFIGCDVPDWLGRFIVRVSSNARLSMSTKQFFFVGSRQPTDTDLSRFFSTYCGRSCVHLIDIDAPAFVNELHSRWASTKPANPVGSQIEVAAPAADDQGSIFIGYVRERGRRAEVG